MANVTPDYRNIAAQLRAGLDGDAVLKDVLYLDCNYDLDVGFAAIPCRFTGRLDRTVTGSLHAGKSVEVRLAGGWPMWVPCTRIFLNGSPLTAAEAIEAATMGPNYVA